ncbi:Hsp20/alpha crystallin family protein [Oleidesulfovibrio sp.]|uniref:Hsp20/alpha crystallin family protein n=1 Tax=Oleidesulfovibrio sp. TaxID=2909707 RepID=UPI003A8389F3
MSSEVIKKTEKAMQKVVPATDIIEMEDGFHIMVELPGVSGDGLNIDLEENEVVITGRSSYVAREGRKLHSEFEPCEFIRTFTVSDVVDKERITASMKNGLLNLHLPKAEAAKPRKIEIRSA